MALALSLRRSATRPHRLSGFRSSPRVLRVNPPWQAFQPSLSGSCCSCYPRQISDPWTSRLTPLPQLSLVIDVLFQHFHEQQRPVLDHHQTLQSLPDTRSSQTKSPIIHSTSFGMNDNCGRLVRVTQSSILGITKPILNCQVFFEFQILAVQLALGVKASDRASKSRPLPQMTLVTDHLFQHFHEQQRPVLDHRQTLQSVQDNPKRKRTFQSYLYGCNSFGIKVNSVPRYFRVTNKPFQSNDNGKFFSTTTAFSRHRCLVATLPRTATSSPGSPPDVAVSSRHAQLPNEVPSHTFNFFWDEGQLCLKFFLFQAIFE